MTTVEILGPNNLDGMMHIHRAGCGDIKRNAIYRLIRRERGGAWTADVSTEEELVEEIWGDIMEDTGRDWERFRGEQRIFPCVKGLA